MIEIKGRIPSKKNSKRRTWKFLISSKAYMDWHKQNIQSLRLCEKISWNCSVEIHIRFPDKRRSDLTNKAESIMDILVDAGVLEDDSWKVVNSLKLSWSYDKENPWAEIKISNL
jgi:Holliday junction resolvase RusA-like endonuclease